MRNIGWEANEMESTLCPTKTIEYIPQPAFLVKDGYITALNEAAAHMQIKTGASIYELIKIGSAEYAAFQSGRLYLELTVARAWVSICDDSHLFCLDNPYADPELKALALAAQHLREPLSNAMIGIDQLKQNEALTDNESLKQQLSNINRSIHTLLRSVCNMSDAAPTDIGCKANLQIQNATSVFFEIYEKLSSYIEKSGRTLKFVGLKQPVECAIDGKLMERAILNIISNAIKFSPEGSVISLTVKQIENRLSVAVENTVSADRKDMYSSCFQQYRRMPGLEDGLTGIGLGMSVVSGIMTAHSGTVLLDTGKKNTARVTLSFPIRTNINTVLRSPIQLLGGYTGGIDSYLVELADVLPDHYYE